MSLRRGSLRYLFRLGVRTSLLFGACAFALLAVSAPNGVHAQAVATTTLPSNDFDGDGIPDEIDPCTSSPDRYFGGARLKVNRINRETIPGNDDMRLRGSFSFPGPLANADPPTTGVRLLLYSDTAQLLADVTVPGGPGWSSKRRDDGIFHYAKFVFTDPSRANHGIRKVKIRGLSHPSRTVLIVKILARGADYPVAEHDLPVRATVIAGDGQYGECADTVFDPNDCAFGSLGRRLICR